jgi:hypothetical protein
MYFAGGKMVGILREYKTLYKICFIKPAEIYILSFFKKANKKEGLLSDNVKIKF